MSDEMIECCPDCKGSRFNVRPGGMGGRVAAEDTGRYYCKNPDCHAEFDVPETRKRERDGNRQGLSATLASIGEQRDDVEIGAADTEGSA